MIQLRFMMASPLPVLCGWLCMRVETAPFPPSLHSSGLYWPATTLFPAARLRNDKSVSPNIRGRWTRRFALGMRFVVFLPFLICLLLSH